MRGGQLKTGNSKAPAHAACANDELVRLQSQPTLRFDRRSVGETCTAGLFVDGHSKRIQQSAKRGMRAHLFHNFTHTLEKPGELQNRFTHSDAVLTELTGISQKPRSVRQRTDGHGTIVRRHAAKSFTRYQSRLRAKFSCP